ncbi:MAG: prepilin-type N-terminal cleavage/methylation domain-containing protein [Clostridia bacterium]|nr:prepilin-type N-terminal cleavage/methylation domain-containing protein [Clostridia bacterium]
MISRNEGVTLIELIIALAVIAIISSSFYGIQLSFTRINQISRQHLTAGSEAGNLYERAKGMTISEFVNWTAAETLLQDNILYCMQAERFWPEGSRNSKNYLDLVITKKMDNGFCCYSMGDSIDDTYSFSGSGLLQIQLSTDENYTILRLEDEENSIAYQNFPSVDTDRIVNIHTHGMDKEQTIIVKIEEQIYVNYKINVYEPYFHKGQIEFRTENQVINIKQIWQAYQYDNLLLASRKSETSKGIPFYLQIQAYGKDKDGQWDIKPISRRQGVISLMSDLK